MTDQDRGAYTPQTDAPLAFDARRVRGAGGGPAPVTLVISAAVGLLLLIAILLFYRSGVRSPGAAPQVVGAPVAQTKAPAPADAASSAAPTVQIETPPPSEGKAPTFAAPPETPAARSAPTVAVQSAPIPPAAAASLRPAQIDTAPPPVAAATPAPPPSASSTHPAPAMAAPATTAPPHPKPAPVPQPAPVTASAAPTAGEPLVQIGAFTSVALAQKGWHDTAAVLPSRMAGRTAKVEKTTRPDGKTFYRSYVGGFASHAQAESFCEALKAAGKTCIVR